MALRKNERVPALRHHDEGPRPLYVVVGDGDHAGRIKTEYFAQNKDPACARIDWDTQQGRRIRIKSISIDSDLEARGWLLLEEEYIKEGRLDDWQQFQDFQAACRRNQVYMDDDIRKETRGDPCPGFPTEMLPASVQALAKRGRGPNYYWKPKAKDAGETELASELPDDGGARSEPAATTSSRGRRS